MADSDFMKPVICGSFLYYFHQWRSYLNDIQKMVVMSFLLRYAKYLVMLSLEMLLF